MDPDWVDVFPDLNMGEKYSYVIVTYSTNSQPNCHRENGGTQ